MPIMFSHQVARAEEAVWLDMASVPDDDLNSYCMAGYKLVARGHVAVLLVCSSPSEEGGLSRVTADIGLPSTKSLLQIFAERIRRIQKLSIEALTGPGSGVMHLLPFYIMASSSAQEEALKVTLESQSYYGLDPEQVVVFYPGDVTVPMLSEEGKIVMESPYKASKTSIFITCILTFTLTYHSC
jgi:UDP-N-acetylglucosamine/UDP-N-acetylgalactosamine diphosphorylase